MNRYDSWGFPLFPGRCSRYALPALLAITLAAACVNEQPVAPDAGADAEPPPSPSLLLIANSNGNDIVRFEQQSARFVDVLVPAGTLDSPDTLALHDDQLYVSSGTTPESSAIVRFDASTGDHIDNFAEGGGLHRPYGFAFGPDGYLYVASFLTDQILRYQADNGEFVDVFAQGTGEAGTTNGPNGLNFGPDGKLYVTTQGSVAVDGEPTFPGLPSEVLRFDVGTGVAEVFVTGVMPLPDSAGYVSLLGVAFGPDCPETCEMFVSDFANGIRRYDMDGNLIDEISTSYTGTPTSNATGSLSFGDNGKLFAVGFDSTQGAGNPGAILRFEGPSGAPAPLPGNDGALLVPESEHLVRPIGILAVASQ